MKNKNKGRNAKKVLVLAAGLFLAGTAFGQNTPDYNPINYPHTNINQPLEEIVQHEQYNFNSFTNDNTDSIYNLRESLWGDAEPIRWLLDIPNIETTGQHFEVLESKTDEGVAYPAGFSIDDHWYYGVLQERPVASKAIALDYLDTEGFKIATIWMNKEDPTFFDIERRFMNFFLPGELEDYIGGSQIEDGSNFGPREIWIYGGSESGYHYGIDLKVPRGTPLHNPALSKLSIGYGQSAGFFATDNISRLFWEPGSKRRQAVRRSIESSIFHLDGYSQEILERFEEEGANDNFMKKMSEYPGGQIHRLLNRTGKNGEYSRTRVNVDPGEIIGIAGWTGKSTAPHVHFQVSLYLTPGSRELEQYNETLNLQQKENPHTLTNGKQQYFTNPELFMNRYMIQKAPLPEGMTQYIRNLNQIIDYKINN